MEGKTFDLELGGVSLYSEKGIVLGHVISNDGVEVDKAKIDVIANLSPYTYVKDVRSFLGMLDFILDLLKTLTRLLRPYPIFYPRMHPFTS